MPTVPTAPTLPTTPPDPQNRATFDGLAFSWSNSLPPFSSSLSALATNVYNNAVEVATNAITVATNVTASESSASYAAYSASIAAAAANMKGNWSALVGALNKPASVVHNSKTWALLNHLADVTASQPGVTSDWVDITPAETSYATKNFAETVALPVNTTVNILYNRVTIDNKRELLLFHSDNAVSAVCYDDSTKQFGPAVLLRSTAAKANPAAVLVSTDKVLVATCPYGATTFETVVLTLTGTTITPGAATPTTLPENLAGAGSAAFYKTAVTVGSTYVFALQLASSARLIAVTVSGTTPTNGSPLSLVANSNRPSIRPIDGTRLLALYYSGTALTVKPITVSSGTTLSPGTGATLGTGSAFRYFTALSTGRWAVVYTDTNSYGAVVSVSGTTATATTVQLNAAADAAQGSVVKIGDQLIVQCSTTKINVLTDVSGTATAGTAVTINALNAATSCIGYGADYAVFALSSQYYVIKISGNNPVIDSTNQLTTSAFASRTTMSSGNYPDDGPPLGVLMLSGISVLGVGSPDANIATVLKFSASAKSCKYAIPPAITPFGYIQIFQSQSVLWVAYQADVSAKIQINRVGLIG